MYIVYLDEFGHIGPFVSRVDNLYGENPVFGFAGLILPANRAREFGTWFFNRKRKLLQWEIEKSGRHPATWEKKGASLYTLRNITKYKDLHEFTYRFLNKIEYLGGKIFFRGVQKYARPEKHDSKKLYEKTLIESITQINAFVKFDSPGRDSFILVVDEHAERKNLLVAVTRAMYNRKMPIDRMIEPPFQVESQNYQTLQAADWVAGIIGRIEANRARPDEYDDWFLFRKYYESRISKISVRSGVRAKNAR